MIATALILAFFALGAEGTAIAADIASTDQSISKGRLLYSLECGPCHGPNGRGDGSYDSLLIAKPRDLREGFLRKYSTEDLARRVREGRSLELALDLPAQKARTQSVEAILAYLKRLPELDWGELEAGEWIYIQRCEGCHGVFGHPVRDVATGAQPSRDLSEAAFQSSVPDKDLLEAVRHGRKGMPGLLPRVTQEEAGLVAGYVRLFSPGYETYELYCANCHGVDGRGIGTFVESMPLPTVVFDERYFAEVHDEDLRIRVWHMLDKQQPTMPHFRKAISEDEARAIIEYLKATDRPHGKETPSAALAE